MGQHQIPNGNESGSGKNLPWNCADSHRGAFVMTVRLKPVCSPQSHRCPGQALSKPGMTVGTISWSAPGFGSVWVVRLKRSSTGLALAPSPVHINSMAKSDSALTIRPAKIGPGWSVFIAHEYGASDEIGNFTSEKSAQDWIDTKSTAWLRDRFERKPVG